MADEDQIASLDMTKRSDRVLAGRAIRERWDISDESRKALVEAFIQMALDPNAKERDRNQAMRNLISMDKINLEMEGLLEKMTLEELYAALSKKLMELQASGQIGTADGSPGKLTG